MCRKITHMIYLFSSQLEYITERRGFDSRCVLFFFAHFTQKRAVMKLFHFVTAP